MAGRLWSCPTLIIVDDCADLAWLDETNRYEDV